MASKRRSRSPKRRLSKRQSRRKTSKHQSKRRVSKHKTSKRKSIRQSRRHRRRVHKVESNPCSMRKKSQCHNDPNCNWVKGSGCLRRKGVVSDEDLYEGPVFQPEGEELSGVVSYGMRKSRKSRKSGRKSRKSVRKSRKSRKGRKSRKSGRKSRKVRKLRKSGRKSRKVVDK